MEETSSEDINQFITIFSKLSSISRREAIRELISTLDSEELDMIIEVIDNKIDDTAAAKARDSKSAREVETDHLEDSGVSSISPSETTCDKVRLLTPTPSLVLTYIFLAGRRGRDGCDVLPQCPDRGE